MKILLFSAASALALAATPAAAQMMTMPGMTMDHGQHRRAAKKPAIAKKTVVKKTVAKKTVAKKPSAASPAAPHAGHGVAMPATDDRSMPIGQGSMPMDHGSMPMGGGSMPMAVPGGPAQPAMPMDHGSMAGMDHGAMAGMHDMKAGLGPYSMNREASGTSWQPDTSNHMGVMAMAGGWHLMGMGVLNLVADTQGSRRGADKLFPSGMLMGMAQHPLGDGTLQFKAMLSPDPIMGKRGYPLLLASGETADGVTRLVDRQHPHDFFMELSASVSQNVGRKGSVFLYAGLPGEPAFGPPTFMHRESIMDSPEAPIAHHWLDSTHISFGVLTAGAVLGNAKVEVSRFNGREPDQHRWNIETGPLDSTAVRLSWNPTRELSLQGSWGHFKDPEQLEPGVDQERLSASAIYTRQIGPDLHWSTTLAWGRKTVEHHKDDAFVLESSVRKGEWTVFGRGEVTENSELLDTAEHGPSFRVGKVSLGAVRDVPVAEHVALGVGALASVNFLPADLAPLYGGRHPLGAMGFVRMKVN
ncbi:hypothetical protein HMF7854_07575 [Sphingomonas ginkgonis]|uniref:Uncharacterized protein n=1 Tax=Sphingomonas ginkgonis TaxID=2315330 RepID=A0A3R9YIL1_9SPHN|nr:hypothetical protein [Sphingomonas ginkgonis]RST30707.1 hypothetical protein HMF7854_07575 [Sphingomonas ginkgonis]